MATAGYRENVNTDIATENGGNDGSPSKHSDSTTPTSPVTNHKPGLAQQIDVESDTMMKETTNALGTVSTPSNHFSFNDYGIIDTPQIRHNLYKNGMLGDSVHSTSDLRLYLEQDPILIEGDPSSGETTKNPQGDSYPHPPATASAPRSLTAETHSASISNDNSPIKEIPKEIDQISTQMEKTFSTADALEKDQSLGDGQTKVLDSEVNADLFQTPPSSYTSIEVTSGGRLNNVNLNLPSFLLPKPVSLLPDHPDSLQQIKKTSAGFLRCSGTPNVDQKGEINIGWDDDLHQNAPLERRGSGETVRSRHRSSPRSNKSSPTKQIKSPKLKQLKLTSLFSKEGRALNLQDAYDSGLGSLPLGEEPSGLYPLGASHPPAAQDPKDPEWSESITIGDSPTIIITNENAETPNRAGDLSILNALVNKPSDWTVFTDSNRWEEESITLESTSEIDPNPKGPLTDHTKTVHFNPPIQQKITNLMEKSIENVSLSISQLDLDDGADERMTEDPTQSTSLKETLMGVSAVAQTDIQEGSAPTVAPELPFLAEATWKLARNSTRAGIKVRTYARHLEDLSADDTNFIITPWALGTAQIPPYILEDKDLVAKIGTARRLAARGIQRLVAEQLSIRANDQLESAQAHLERAEYLTRKSGNLDWPKAEATLTRMMAKEQTLLTNKLAKRKLWLADRQPTPSDWQNLPAYLQATLRGAQGNQNKVDKASVEKGPMPDQTAKSSANQRSKAVDLPKDFVIPRTGRRPSAPPREGEKSSNSAKPKRGRSRSRSHSRRRKRAAENEPQPEGPSNPRHGKGNKRRRDKEDIPPQKRRPRSNSRKNPRQQGQKPRPEPSTTAVSSGTGEDRKRDQPSDQKWKLLSLLLEKM